MSEEIAIIGMAGRLPGAQNVDEFWENLRDGVESVRPFSEDELCAAGVDDKTRSDPYFVNSGCLADDLDAFDAAFFGIGRREAELMDPQHRVFLEVAWEALERAGYDPEAYKGPIGVYGGVAPNTYRQNILNSRPELLASVGDYLAMICSEREYAVTRVAFKLNLRGPSLSVNTACSSTGVALHLACQSLLAGENDMCLVGGARVRVPLTAGYMYQENGIVSPDGHCRAFDAEARGTAIGNGAAMVVLKRLADARADGDWIHAVIKSTAVNNDGSAKVGFTAPGVTGQSAVISEALALAGVSADSIQYLEAHGTGTSLGDPIEVAAAAQAFRETTDARGTCGIGSVKTNIGHLDAAAGVVGVIKAALALENGQLPPSLNFSRPNPQIDFEGSPFYVVERLQEWPRGATPRRAGVSNFGLGGTNAHIVLEEAPEPESPSPSRRHQLLLLSAATPEALEAATDNLLERLRDPRPLDLADAAHTLQAGRRHFALRRMLVCDDREDAVSVLESRDPRRLLTQEAGQRERGIAFLFPGGGAQYIDMGRDLYDREPTFRATVDRCLRLVEPHIGADLAAIFYPAAGADEAARVESERPSVALPMLFSVEYALAHLWVEWGLRPSAFIGHSMGEYTAACLAGVVSLEDALRIVIQRGRLFEKLEAGSMLSVHLPEARAREWIGERLSIAAINRHSSCVVSGPEDAIADLRRELEAQEIQCKPIHISVAAHSQMVEPILEEFRSFLDDVNLRPPTTPYVSNVTGTWIRPEEATDPDYWVTHLRESVRFSDGLATLFAGGSDVLVEVGPGQTLSTFARSHPDFGRERVVLPSMRHPMEVDQDDAFLCGSLGNAWLAGVPVDWTGYYRNEERRRVPLPTYPFERDRHWVEAAGLPAPPLTAGLPLSVGLHPTAAEPHAPSTPPAEARAPVTDEPRKQRILAELIEVIQDLSGLDGSEVDVHSTFIQLGFDSLLLTQANMAFQRRFDVRITFRQLFEEAPTLDSLADFIDAKLPPEAFPAPAPLEVPPPEQHATSPAAVDHAPSALEQVIREQMSIMREQLAVLQRGQTPASAAPTAGRTGQLAQPSQPAPAPARPGKGSHAGHGPWKPVEGGRLELTPVQRDNLAALVERFNRRTRASKEYAQAHRTALADPRTVAGFRLPWKELVYPIVAERAKGSKLWDIDGNEWMDVTMGFGVTIFGHSPDFITEAIQEQLQRSIAIGPQTALAGEVAELVGELTGLERAAFCNTGSEAVLAAIRAARTVRGRDLIVVFSGAYHGMFDEVVVKGIEVRGELRSIPVAPGIPRSAVEQVLVLEYGDPASLAAIESRADSIAAVLVEPVQSRNPELQPVEFVRALRRLTEEQDIALVFDEMVTGFRLHQGGAQAWYGVQADIATYGKVVGGGMPIGIVAGKAKYLDALDGGSWQFGDDSLPEQGVTWFAGTFVRHPLAVAAARAALLRFREAGPELQEELNKRAAAFRVEANEFFEAGRYPIRLVGFASMFNFRFDEDWGFSSLYFHYLRDRNIHCHERRPHFLTTAHTDEDIESILRAFREAAEAMRAEGFMPDAAGVPAPQVGAPAAGVREIPLTDPQLEVWLAACVNEDASRAFQLSSSIDLEGPLRRDRLEQAIRDLAQRHEALRVTIDASGEHQRIAPSVALELLELDLSALGEDERAERLRAFHASDSEEPFDLAAGPLVRFALLSLSEGRHRVVCTAHHIVCDGWSMGILMRDLGALYEAARSGKAAALPGSPMQFGEFVDDQIRRQQGESGAASEAYWLECFKGDLPLLELPTDHERPAFKTYRGGQRGVELDLDLLDRLKRHATRSGATVFASLLAAYSIFLKRLAGTGDVALGVAVAGQPAAGSKDLVGHCVNLYPLRSGTPLDEPFGVHMAAIRAALVDSLDYPDATYGSLIKKLQVPRDPSRLPLLSTMVTYETETAGLSFGDLRLTVSNNPKRFCNFDIELYLTETAAGLRVEFHYNEDLFEAATIDRWLANYRRLLEALLEDGAGPAARLPMVSDEELRLLDSWSATSAPLPDPCGVHQLVERTARRSPGATALVFPAAAGDAGAALSYGELDGRANQLARHLRRGGVTQGDLVAVCLPRSPDILVALLGVLKAGAAYVPLDPSFPRERLRFMLSDSGACAVVTEADLATQLSAGDATFCCLDRDAALMAREPSESLGLDVAPESLAYVIYTSGSTGRPKGVEIPHRAVANLLSSVARTPGFTPEDSILAVTTFGFDIAAVDLWLPLVVGGRIVLASDEEVLDGEGLAQLIESHGVTVLQATPATWRLLLESGWQGSPHLEAICTGEALPLELAEALAARTGSLWNMYGPTETTIWSTAAEYRHGAGRVTIGRPIANTRIQILDAVGQRVPIGVVGELCIGGAGLARGYLDRPELTDERFVPDPFSGADERLYRTGDSVRWLASGELDYRGRNDGQVKLRGFRIELGEIETVLGQHPNTKEAAVTLREDEPGDQRLVAYVVARGGSQVDTSDLRAHLRSKLPGYMVPASFVELESLPLTPNRKLDRNALPAPSREQLDSGSSYVAPRTPTETTMAGIWSEILRIDRMSVADDFFDLGGHSLLAVRLIARLQSEFGVQVVLRDLLESPTVVGLAEVIDAMSWAADEPDERTNRENRIEIDL